MSVQSCSVKMVCTGVAPIPNEDQTQPPNDGSKGKRLTFATQYSESVEDQQFAAAAQNGSFNIDVTNPAALGFFRQGEAYLFTVTHAGQFPQPKDSHAREETSPQPLT